MIKTEGKTKIITANDTQPDVWVTPDATDLDVNIMIDGRCTWLEIKELEELIEVLQDAHQELTNNKEEGL